MLPPYIELWEELKRRGGIAKDTELFKILKSKYEISRREFNKLLMMMELRGYIHVEHLKRNEKLVRALR
ncbi:hypothetical protein DRN89_02225 [archaeon]|nr:MAG: hypothetical protein DRN89_02225 [archaeon]